MGSALALGNVSPFVLCCVAKVIPDSAGFCRNALSNLSNFRVGKIPDNVMAYQQFVRHYPHCGSALRFVNYYQLSTDDGDCAPTTCFSRAHAKAGISHLHAGLRREPRPSAAMVGFSIAK